MAKKESTLIQLILTLTLISVIAGVSLAAVYTVTKEPIDQAAAQKKATAIQQVLPGFTGDLKEYKYGIEEGKDSITVYMAYNGEELFGAAVETYTNKAFGGRFDLMVGLDAQGNVLETVVLKHGETPGLGDKINKDKSDFSIQFRGKENPEEYPLSVRKDGGNIDAITAATISSRAFCDAVNRASIAFNHIKNENHE